MYQRLCSFCRLLAIIIPVIVSAPSQADVVIPTQVNQPTTNSQVQNLMRIRKEQMQMLQNVLSADVGLDGEPDAQAQGQPQVPGQPTAFQADEQLRAFNDQVAAIQSLASTPLMNHVLKLSADPKFRKNLDTVTKDPKRKTVFKAEIGWIIFIILFRAWLTARPGNWLKQFWRRTWSGLVYIGGASFVIPVFLLGAPYSEVLRSVGELFWLLMKQAS